MNQQNNNNMTVSSIQFSNEVNQQQSVNAASGRYTKEDCLVLIRLYGEYYRETTAIDRVLSPRRIQLDKQSWETLTAKYNEETKSQRSGKGLKEKWDLLKNHYMNAKSENGKTGSGGGPLSDCDQEIHKILQADPQVEPPYTFDSMAGETRRREEDSSEQDGHDEPVNKKKKTRGSGSKRRVEAENKFSVEAEKFLSSSRALAKDTLVQIKELVQQPIVVQHTDSEDRKKRMDEIRDIMKAISDKLKDSL